LFREKSPKIFNTAINLPIQDQIAINKLHSDAVYFKEEAEGYDEKQSNNAQ
jgi:hypothetical protein